MKICLVHEEYPEETNFGGIATYQKLMAEEFVKQGNKVYVICRGLKKNKRYIENGVSIIRIFQKKSDNQVYDYVEYRKKVADELLKLQNKKEIDIIEVPDWGAETVMFEDKRTVPLVVRLHTPLKVWLKYNKNDFGKVKNLMLKWEEKMMKSADMITCCSNALKNIIVKEFKIPELKINVTPNPANIVNFYKQTNAIKEDSLLFIGSLEERKGVCVLAQALNDVLKKYPNLKVKFIGKDTTRNRMNISTKEFIYNTVDKKHSHNLEFLGQLPNNELNYYLNKSKIAVFPSLFDNFPYVVLESMATGIQIVGSKNSGMVEMLDDPTSIYKTGDSKDLAKKIIDKYKLTQTEIYNERNMLRLKTLYNPNLICGKMLKMYKQLIESDCNNDISKSDIEKILSNINEKAKVNEVLREKNGVSNCVYRVYTKSKIYIIKKYLYNYDFSLSEMLYNVYEKNGIDIIRPINRNLIEYNGHNYNIFDYKKVNVFSFKSDIRFLSKAISCDRKVNMKNTILYKCNKYYDCLNKIKIYDRIPENDIKYILNVYAKLKDLDIFKEKYLNHGDLSKWNILKSNNKMYIIDFDETTITTPLYDFSVAVVKRFIKNDKINYGKYNKIKSDFCLNYNKYNDTDFKNCIKFYLCKIILEKFYLHQNGEIDIYSKRQLKDNYNKYLKILKNI